ncbi:MAG: hypothetical protein V4696_03765 [Pseudomonadota bacterium]
MPTIQESLTTIRDAAHINAHALELIATEAEEFYETIRTWPDSSVKRDMLAQLATTITAFRTAQREANDLKTVSQEGLQSSSNDPVPLPPPYPDIPSAGGTAQWSVRDW